MSETLVQGVVEALNLQLDVPFLDDVQEASLIRWTVEHLAELLPPFVLEFVNDAADGLNDSESLKWEDWAVAKLNALIDLPWFPESFEEIALRRIVSAVLEFARSGKSIFDNVR